ncbi:hypothetical protein [Roseomonas sp. BN140053]|uniref:hypothetical protein n=1 Tax=Roseomonas sp. BN140053 TaxID=3391898 RepID=UPI0039E8E823
MTDHPAPEPLPPARARLRPLLATLPALLPALFFLGLVLSPPLNQDVAAVLSFAQRMVAGEPLYSQLIDVNPPLIFLLNLPAALLAAHTPLDGVWALLLLLLCFCALVFALCLRLRPPGGPAERAMLIALPPLLLVLAGFDFGQREQIMAAAALPYLFLAERRAQGTRTGGLLVATATTLAAVGFALKPHFLAVPALVEAVVLAAALRRGRLGPALRDPVPWGLLALWVAYAALIVFGFPDYFGRVVPLVWDHYVGLGGASWWRVALTPQLFTAALTTVAAVLFAACGGTGAIGWLPRLAAAAMLGGLAAALVQHKGWSYHVLPVWIWGGLLCGLALARAADALMPARAAARAAPMLAAGACVALALLVMRGGEAPWREFNYRTAPVGRLAEWLEREAPDGRLLVLSPDIYPAYPALNYAENRPVLRFMSTWLLQAVYGTCPADGGRFRAPADMGPAERFLFDAVAQDFAAARPAAVLVSRDAGIPWCANQPFDMLAYFSRHPRFAETWRGYYPAGEIDGYLLFERNAEAPPPPEPPAVPMVRRPGAPEPLAASDAPRRQRG